MVPALLLVLVITSMVTYVTPTTPLRAVNPQDPTHYSQDGSFTASEPDPPPLLAPSVDRLSRAVRQWDIENRNGIYLQFPWSRPFNFTAPKAGAPKSYRWWKIVRFLIPGCSLFALICCCCCCNKKRGLEPSISSLLELESRSCDKSREPPEEGLEAEDSAVAYTIIPMPSSAAPSAPLAVNELKPGGKRTEP
ncbi:sperm acrosome-associated protein 5-like [Platysternon megacephalum]|uniref:Sperm acrosome-associated protein 5-like n=1 Tax=Platysternon megacephalum TaxID=55544 RepID=A0A4D9DJ03_9SAUR|nr:sperm acrosome-associated protein 5-like [Platysternon megacephalum]